VTTQTLEVGRYIPLYRRDETGRKLSFANFFASPGDSLTFGYYQGKVFTASLEGIPFQCMEVYVSGPEFSTEEHYYTVRLIDLPEVMRKLFFTPSV